MPDFIDWHREQGYAIRGLPWDVWKRELLGLGTERLRSLCRTTGIPESLRAVGIPEAALPDLARSAMQVTRLLKNNPREVAYEDALRLFRSIH